MGGEKGEGISHVILLLIYIYLFSNLKKKNYLAFVMPKFVVVELSTLLRDDKPPKYKKPGPHFSNCWCWLLTANLLTCTGMGTTILVPFPVCPPLLLPALADVKPALTLFHLARLFWNHIFTCLQTKKFYIPSSTFPIFLLRNLWRHWWWWW